MSSLFRMMAGLSAMSGLLVTVAACSIGEDKSER